MKTRTIRILSLLLTVLLLIQFSAVITFAQEEAAEPAETEAGNPVSHELTALRGPDVKYFIHKDGKTMTAVQYDRPVHYRQADGSWAQIDNTLIEAGADTWQTAENAVAFLFNKKSKGTLFTLSAASGTLRFSLEGARQTNAVRENPAASDRPFSPEGLASRVSYPDIFDGVDLVFDLVSQTVKDNVIFQTPQSVRPVTYKIHTGEHTLTLNDDRSLDIFSADGKLVYTMAAPHLTDAAGAYSEAVTLTLETSGSIARLRAEADPAWMQDPARVYPITLDPEITVDGAAAGSYFRGTRSQDPNVSSSDTYVGTDASGAYRSYLKPALPVLETVSGEPCYSVYVMEAILSMPLAGTAVFDQLASSTRTIELRESTTAFGTQPATWNTLQASLGSTVAESFRSASVSASNRPQTLNFDITALVSRWYRGSSNNGLIFKFDNETVGGTAKKFNFKNSPSISGCSPTLTITYQDLAGVDDTHTYIEQELGTAGTASISNATGQLHYSFSDYAATGERFPFEIKHVYSLANYGTASDACYGLGFQLNLCERVAYYDDASMVHIDASGHRTYYDLMTEGYTPEAGETSRYACRGRAGEYLSYGTFENAGYYKLWYEARKESRLYSPQSGLLVQARDNQVDQYGNHINRLHLNYTNGRLNYVTDAVGRNVTFAYNSAGLLQSLTYPDGTSVSYQYTDGRLTGVARQAGAESCPLADFAYTVTTAGTRAFVRLTAITDRIDHPGRTLAFSYYEPTAAQLVNAAYLTGNAFAVTGCTVRQGEEVLEQRTFEYTYNSFTVSNPEDGTWERHALNQEGLVISAENSEGYAQYYRYGGGGRNLLLNSSDVQCRAAVNYLKNANFSTGTGWVTSGASRKPDTAENPFGAYLALANNAAVSQSVAGLQSGKTYTYSLHVYKSETIAGDLVLWMRPGGAETRVEKIQPLSELKTGWNRIGMTVHFDAGTDMSAFQAGFSTQSLTGQTDGAVQVYADAAQLVEGNTAQPFNWIENAGFERGTEGFQFVKTTGSAAEQALSYDADHNVIEEAGDAVFKLKGKSDEGYMLMQEIPVSGTAGDTFVFGADAKAIALPEKDAAGDGSQTSFSITVRLMNGSEAVQHSDLTAFNHYYDGWQYLCGELTAEEDFTAVKLFLKYKYNCNTAYFDDVVFYRSRLGTDYTYDAQSGALTQMKDSAGNVTNISRDGDTTTVGDTTVTTTNGKVTGVSNGRITESYTYGLGSVLLSKTVQDHLYGGSYTTSAAYDSEENYPVSQTDENGKTTYYEYDGNNTAITRGLLTKVTYPDQAQDVMEYDSLTGRLTRVTRNSSQYAQYTYTGAALTGISNGSTSYQFAYNTRDALTGISVTRGGQTAVLHSYIYDARQRLISEQTGGNTALHYLYDESGKLSAIRQGESDLYRYTYDAAGLLTQTEDCTQTPHRFEYYTYDFEGGLLKKTTSDGLCYTPTENGESWSLQIGSLYLSSGMEAATREIVLAEETTDVQGNTVPAVTDEQTTLTYSGDLTYTAVWDQLNRLQRLEYGRAGSGSVSGRNFTYSGSRVISDGIYQYTYDAGGRITKTSYYNDYDGNDVERRYTYDSHGRISNDEYYNYTYDAQSRLSGIYIQENGTDVGLQHFWNEATGFPARIFDYNAYTHAGGNTYFTSDVLGVSRIEGYTDSGEEHYTGWDITRDARNQITGLEKIWDEWRDIEPDYLNVSYCYNDQGMRTRKSIDEAALPRESVYYYNGTQLIFEAQYQAGALLRVLGFQYDPQGSPLYLTLWNNPADAAQYTVYRYQYNLLGEIEKLLLVKSVNGTSVTYPNTEAASYTYSAFGKIMAQSGEMAAINPIRYKGYYYDIETGWYYLQSRYYSPEWGIFLTLDDPGILLASADEQLSMDLVAYCGNDPVNYVDSSGQWAEKYKGFDNSSKYGFSVYFNIRFLSKTFSFAFACDIVHKFGGWSWIYGFSYKNMTPERIAIELYAHAVLYAVGTYLIESSKIQRFIDSLFYYLFDDGFTTIADLMQFNFQLKWILVKLYLGTWLIERTKSIDVNYDEGWKRMAVFTIIWNLGVL